MKKEETPTKFSLPNSGNPKLKVFIGSKMMELRDVREIVENALCARGIKAFVYEYDAGARPDSVEKTSLDEVEAADIYVGLFWEKYGEVTVEEFQRARSLNRPCFIYIRDKNMTREGSLENFLKAEVYDLSKGLTYAFFDKALDLGSKIAEDIMAWLVRRHREMTAEIGEARISKDEIVRLQAEVNRLQSVSQQLLPQGTVVDYLSQYLRAWFVTMGYRFESYEVLDDNYFEWIIEVPARRGYDRILVRGVEGEADLNDVTALRHSVNNNKVNEGWLIAARRKSQAASAKIDEPENADLFCYTFDELIDESANFDGYFKWLDNEVRNRHINEMYIPLGGTKEEFGLNGKSIGQSKYDESNGWIEAYIDRWLDDPAKEHISVLGEFGTGKTWFTLHYAWKAMQNYLNAKERGLERPRLPLVIPLRDYAKAVSVESLFSEFFFRKHEIPLPGYSAFEQLNRMGKLLLIFDGFDEMAAKVDRQQMINNFWELARVVVPGAKAILTCRTEHFPEASEGRALLNAELKASTAALTGRPPQFEVIELLKLSDAQIRKMLSFRTSIKTVEEIMNNDELLDLARRPVMTEYILEALPDIEAGKPIDLSRIYMYAVRRKLERDFKEERSFTSIADKLYFLSEVSWEMISQDKMSLNYRLFPDRLRNLFGDAVREQKDLDHWHYDMMGQSLLTRNSDGDYTPAHRSLLEFFVAYKFTAELGLLNNDFQDLASNQSNIDPSADPREYTWSNYFRREMDQSNNVASMPRLREFVAEPMEELIKTFGSIPLTKAISDLMLAMLRSNNEVKTDLFSIINSTRGKTRDEALNVGGNAVTLLVRIDSDALSDQDLSKVNIKSADLTGLEIRNALFCGADLSNALLAGSKLIYCDFTGSHLDGIKMDEINGYITGISTTNGMIEFVFPPNSFLQTEHGKLRKLPFRLKDNEIAITLMHNGECIWAFPIDSDAILDAVWFEPGIQVLTIEGKVIDINRETGDMTVAKNVEPTKRWLGSNLSDVKGLSVENSYFISIYGALNLPKTSYSFEKHLGLKKAL